MSAGASPVPALSPLVADAHAPDPILFSVKLPKSTVFPVVLICAYCITSDTAG